MGETLGEGSDFDLIELTGNQAQKVANMLSFIEREIQDYSGIGQGNKEHFMKVAGGPMDYDRIEPGIQNERSVAEEYFNPEMTKLFIEKVEEETGVPIPSSAEVDRYALRDFLKELLEGAGTGLDK